MAPEGREEDRRHGAGAELPAAALDPRRGRGRRGARRQPLQAAQRQHAEGGPAVAGADDGRGQPARRASGPDKRTDRYRALVLVLAYAGLRFGEATALRRSDVLDDGRRLRVERGVRYLDGQWVVGDPKTDAGRSTVSLPPSLADVLADHLEHYVPDSPDALVFGTSAGTFLHSANFGQVFRRAVEACGLPPVRPHELRHTGATWAAQTGATTAELMRRMGHSTPAAAMRYQHALDHRDDEIARALDGVLTGSVVALRKREGHVRDTNGAQEAASSA
ncbi:tyrosine-type recombinase/integrase [Blastococcus sp. SYSU D00669]